MSYLVASRRRDPLSEWFNAPFRTVFPAVPTARPSATWSPSAEVVREGDDALVRLEVPGLTPEDITVEVADGRLVVSGERRDERAEEQDGRTVREIRYGTFRRSFALPARISESAISASYDAGVLTVRVAGVYAGSEPVRIPVTGTAPAAVEA
ncbi:Hsp20/alpha crystallin family protein [Sporichthya polymorpha]|uniref:Hsp20/alpha crystallin family protein n=1 Tax=Sporichthya polymorpha TaxID=35751 RepID=UPI00037A1165|nr:Hsp20/alpha crystallin family protein [Sporichthya polymorpha]